MKLPTPNHSTNPSRQPTAARRGDAKKTPPPKTVRVLIEAVAPHLSNLRRQLVTRRVISSIGLLLIITTGYAIVSSVRGQQTDKNEAATLSSQVVEDLEYQTVLPADKAISTLGGWRQISPPGSEPVYAYSDTIGTVDINVSQQPIPQSFKNNVNNHVGEIAKKGSYTTKLDADGTSVYIGTSAKGPQSVIFTKNELLILMKSQQKIDDTAWVSYVKSLN